MGSSQSKKTDVEEEIEDNDKQGSCFDVHLVHIWFCWFMLYDVCFMTNWLKRIQEIQRMRKFGSGCMIMASSKRNWT